MEIDTNECLFSFCVCRLCGKCYSVCYFPGIISPNMVRMISVSPRLTIKYRWAKKYVIHLVARAPETSSIDPIYKLYVVHVPIGSPSHIPYCTHILYIFTIILLSPRSVKKKTAGTYSCWFHAEKFVCLKYTPKMPFRMFSMVVMNVGWFKWPWSSLGRCKGGVNFKKARTFFK